MSRYFPRITTLVLVVGAVAAMSTSAFATGISASATITATQIGPDEFNYKIDVTNTGTVPIETFWFSWVPGAGFLPGAKPTDVVTPTGWTDTITNGPPNSDYAIRWENGTSPLAPGQSVDGFDFDSTDTPAELLGDFPGTSTGAFAGDPILTTFVYPGLGAVGTGDQFLTTETPEPGTLLLTFSGLGLAAALFAFRRKGNSTKTPICQLT